MTVNIYPAFNINKTITHVDDFDDDSTLNIAHGNFYALVETMGISRIAVAPGTISIKAMEMALNTSPRTNYTDRLRKICAIAHIKKANCIAFS